jgi:hypothetical protein
MIAGPFIQSLAARGLMLAAGRWIGRLFVQHNRCICSIKIDKLLFFQLENDAFTR